MDPRPIGVFDSGVGGLTVVRQLQKILPSEHILYFGDTARVPYGGRDRETLLGYARQVLSFMQSHQVKAVVAACGTISTTCLPRLQEESDLPMVGVMDPACRRSIEVTRSGKVGVIATQASINSGVYQRTIEACGNVQQVTAQACPKLVPLVESGRCSTDDVETMEALREYLEPMQRDQVDTLLLGCTHYPLLSEAIRAILGPEVTLVDSGAEAAGHLMQMLQQRDMLAPKGPGSLQLYASGQPEPFAALAERILGEPCHALQLDIERY
ncbi:MAG: glutamate racemase [Ruminococcaceae bacterium]|nr:glutamate racemase [Oscillospiraceae bacterium]